MVFMRDRRPEQREDAIASGLHNVAIVAVDGIDHEFECWIDNRAVVFGVELLHQLHRAFDVGEQSGDRLALAIESCR